MRDAADEAAFIVGCVDHDRRSLAMGLGPMYYDRQGQPIGLYDWARLFEDFGYKRVAYTKLPDGRFVSTVWMGLDHGRPYGPMQIFETMLFGRPYFKIVSGEFREVNDDEDCNRYATEYDAFWGHHTMVERHTLRLKP